LIAKQALFHGNAQANLKITNGTCFEDSQKSLLLKVTGASVSKPHIDEMHHVYVF